MKLSLPKYNKRALLKKYARARKRVFAAWNECPKLKKVQVFEGEFAEFRLWECTPNHVIVSTPLFFRDKPLVWADVKDKVVSKDASVLIFIVDKPMEQVQNALRQTCRRHSAPYWDLNNPYSTAYWERGWKWKNCGHTAHALWDTLDGRTIVMRVRTDKRNDSGSHIQTQKEYYKLWRNGVYRHTGLPSDEFDSRACDLNGLDLTLREQAFINIREQVKRVDYMRLRAAAGCEENTAPIRRRKL